MNIGFNLFCTFFLRKALGFKIHRVSDSDEFFARNLVCFSVNYVFQRRIGYKGIYNDAVQRLGNPPKRLQLDGSVCLRFLDVGDALGFHAHTFSELGTGHAQSVAYRPDPAFRWRTVAGFRLHG